MEAAVDLIDRSDQYVDASGFVDVRRLIAAYGHHEHAARADNYFRGIDNPWSHVLRKPFSNLHETPPTLSGISSLLQMLHPKPGDVVVDFGCGTGWLSQALALLGCRPIGLDISQEALSIARAAVAEHPYLSQRDIRFEAITEHGIPLPDESVDRVICFDSFHHVADQAMYIREFHRILKPGGMAGLHEPGPNHSSTPMSQYEMRQFAVIENDIVVEDIAAVAAEAGFEDFRMALFTDIPLTMSPDDYRDMQGRPNRAVVDIGSYFIENNKNRRVFTFRKPGAERLDSRTREGFFGTVDLVAVSSDKKDSARIFITNTGKGSWLASGVEPGCVNIGLKAFDASGAPLNPEPSRLFSVPPLEPGESAEVEIRIAATDLADGVDFEIDLVAEHVAWLSVLGAPTLRL